MDISMQNTHNGDKYFKICLYTTNGYRMPSFMSSRKINFSFTLSLSLSLSPFQYFSDPCMW